MFKVGDYIVYKRDVCLIKDIKEKYFHDIDYYVLSPFSDPSLVIEVPTSNKNGYIRPLIDKKKVEEIINEMPSVGVIEENGRSMENIYKELFNSNEILDLVKIIKTTYRRNKKRIANNKKIGDRDNMYFNKAEKFLYNEFSLVLGMSFKKTKDYVVSRIMDDKDTKE